MKKEEENEDVNGAPDMDQVKAEPAGAVAMEDVRQDYPEIRAPMVIPESATTVLQGHDGEVFVGSWWNGGGRGPSSSSDSFLATGLVSGLLRLPHRTCG